MTSMKNDSFWELLEPIHPKAEGFCRRLTGNRDDGADLYHDALYSALRHFGSLADHARFRPWLYRTIINTFKNRFRRNWWGRLVGGIEMVTTEPMVDPTERYLSRLWTEKALASLKPGERALMVLFEIEGWPVDELAALYGAPTGTIKARLSRTRQKMRAYLLRQSPRITEDTTQEEGYALPGSKTAVE